MNCDSVPDRGPCNYRPKRWVLGKRQRSQYFRMFVLNVQEYVLMSKRLSEAQDRESIRKGRSSGSFKRLVRPRDWVSWDTESQA